jgi:soluble lytic murein transglycosylase-like protein
MTNDTHAGRSPGGFVEKLLVRGGMLAAGAFLLSAVGGWTQVRARAVADSTAAATEAVAARMAGEFATRHDAASPEMRLVRAQLERAKAVHAFAQRYRIDTGLAGAIYDAARRESIAPATAFRLVQVESNFKRTARSTADAFGYTQVQLPTARHYDRTVTVERLMDRDVNLRLGFRYLRDLLSQFEGDMHLALLAYNRGPGRVEQILAEGGDPGNGYSSAVLRTGKPGTTAPMRGVAQ